MIKYVDTCVTNKRLKFCNCWYSDWTRHSTEKLIKIRDNRDGLWVQE